MKFLSLLMILGIFLLPVLCTNEDDHERSLSRQKRKLIYPQYTIYQISMCLVAQISSLTSHRVAINSGFQINYALPFQLKDFYSPIYWARSLTNMSSPIMNFFEKLAKSEESDDETESGEVEEDAEVVTDDDELVTEHNEAELEEYSTTEISTSSTEKAKRKRKPKEKRDLTAGQFYSGLRETMSYSGYHEDCLLKSVCELAKHPLHDDEDNVVHDVMNFILTPSLHQSFDAETEKYEKELYEEAEKMGKAGADCQLMYGSNCEASPLERISHFIHSSNDI